MRIKIFPAYNIMFSVIDYIKKLLPNKCNRSATLMLCLISIAGCKPIGQYNADKYIAHRNTEYLSARSIKHLKIPANLSPESMQEKYPTPATNNLAPRQTVSIVPPGI